MTTDESACATDCEPITDATYPTRPENRETSEDVVTENPTRPESHETSEDANKNPNETSADVKENPYETSVDVSKYPYEASEDANENPCEGRVSQPNVSVRHINIVFENCGLGRSARRRTDLKERATSSDPPDPPQRGEGQVERETEPALSTLDDDGALTYLERVGPVTESPFEEEVEDLKPLDPEGPGPPLPKEETNAVANPEYARLFTPDKRDALEAGRPSPATEVKEEYDKELEQRLFPLDEVELNKKMIKNAAKKTELRLEELSTLLNLPVETLARKRGSSTGELPAPEYWSTWYRRTLAASESESSDERDVGGGGHVCEVTGLHSGGLVPVGESLPSDSVLVNTLENVGQDVGAREDAVHVYGSASVEVGELLSGRTGQRRSEPVRLRTMGCAIRSPHERAGWD
ncbi:hypothetical protein PF007_g8365 [Phytophthora fragariae]|uniref:Uncharacterized protein n=1 Tax=Phytophthora fragariae TaxID=53985 RepID=A0A6A3DYN4_9STRA|nr:hypothetical protein PF009_g23065 [Phytophthora fragariae]KAE9119934.1 hypothetical protein PF007_g8365 [Phytophthora fragariae]KAE9286597.1 hypothetical protein PF001_g21369 [Phytophthora fragariae]